MYVKAVHRNLIFSIFPIIIVLFSSGCGKQPYQSLGLVKDTAKLFSDKEKKELESQLQSLSAKKEVAIILKTSNEKVNPQDISEYLDEVFKKESGWNKPKQNTIKRILGYLHLIDRPQDKTMEIIILKSPSFLGIRYGRDSQFRAFSSGILHGQKYVNIQNTAYNGDFQSALNSFLLFFEQNFSAKLSRYRKVVKNEYAYYINKIIDKITLNHWGFYNKFLLRPILRIQIGLGKFIHWPKGASLAFVCLSIIIIVKLVGYIGKLSKYLILLRFPILLIISMPAISSVLLLAHGRLEDRLFVSYLVGVPIDKISFLSSSIFSDMTGLWCIALAIIPALKSLVSLLWLIPLTDLSSNQQEYLFGELDTMDQFLFALGQIDIDVDWNVEEPFTSATEVAFTRIVRRYIGNLVIFSILPLIIPLYFALVASFEILANLRSSIKGYKGSKSLAANMTE